ncbi:MAG: arsenic resistance protein [Synechococcales cyanobacterium C42_A2020_086]|jgi:ACR3 family arsenite efflux pump ArsB|nr:arsenic resistance protein [Synechococcales cyanobacterium C42_A2020_086]
MSRLDKLQPFFTLLSVLFGLMLAQVSGLAPMASALIVPLLAVMLYATFLPMPLQQVERAIRNLNVTAASLGMNFLWTPILAWGLGAVFLRDTPDLWVGLIMLMVTPCTDWYLVFTSIAGGDVSLATALLPFNLILQIVLLPIYLLVFTSTLVELNPQVLFGSILWVLLLPLLIAFLSRRSADYRWGKEWLDCQVPKITALQVICLNIAIIAIFTAESRALFEHPGLLLQLLPPVILFFLINFWVAQTLGRQLQLSYATRVCLTYTTLARNSPLSLAIAASTFADRPLITLTLVIGPLIELPILILVSQRLRVLGKTQE